MGMAVGCSFVEADAARSSLSIGSQPAPATDWLTLSIRRTHETGRMIKDQLFLVVNQPEQRKSNDTKSNSRFGLIPLRMHGLLGHMQMFL